MSAPPVASGCDATHDEDDEDQTLTKGCALHYVALEECLGENARDWRQCQREMKAFKACFAASTGGAPPKPPKPS